MLAIETEGLEKRYRGLFGPGQVALAGVSLAVPRGAAFGLIGPNGAGKTTFIKALLGIVHPSAGTVRLLGGDPQDPRTRARVGYLPERLQLPHAWTPRQLLQSVARLKGLARPAGEIERVLVRVGLASAERRIGGFSKGMRQRLGLAAALLGQPELLVLDEPTDGIDPIGRMDVRHILQGELARGATLFLNSHLLSETERVCTRVAILAGGKVAREGALDALCASDTRWQVRFEGGRPAEAGFDVTDTPGRFTIAAADPAALNAALDRARQGGALILEVARDVRTLEEVLAQAVGAGA